MEDVSTGGIKSEVGGITEIVGSDHQVQKKKRERLLKPAGGRGSERLKVWVPQRPI